MVVMWFPENIDRRIFRIDFLTHLNKNIILSRVLRISLDSFLAHSSDAQCLFMTLCSGVIPEGLGNPLPVLGFEPGLTSCKTSAITPVLAL